MKMKLCMFFICAIGFAAKAQVPNSGFEQLNASTGNVKNWGMVFITQVYFDSSGVAHQDSIVFDNQLYFAGTDAYQGNYALEMRNAYNYTTGQQIAGRAMLSADSINYSGFAGPAAVASNPVDFSFYYKFFPTYGDTAIASISVLDNNGNEIGSAEIAIADSVTSYALATTPVVYYQTGTVAAFVNIEFRTARPGSPANFGTRFLVDEVNLMATGINESLNDKIISVYPNPGTGLFAVSCEVPAQCIQVTDVQGNCVFSSFPQSTNTSINLSNQANGMYFVKVISEQGQITKRVSLIR